MIRRLLPLVALFVASTLFAADRMMDSGMKTPGGATVSGIVTSVSGNLVQLAGGAITLDATDAKVLVDRTKDATVAAIEPGMIVFAVLGSSDAAANAPLPAVTITATRLPDATLFGPVQSVDTTAKTLTLLGRTIRVTPETSFGGFTKRRDGSSPGLGDLLPGHLVQVQADSSGGALVAASVMLVAPAPPEVQAMRGTVESIATDSWVIGRERGDDVTVRIDAQTKIVGSPKVGDVVDVLYRVDGSHAFIAISIVKWEKPPVPPIADIFRFSGTVKAIDAQAWVITREGVDQKVRIEPMSKIEPGIAVGDAVEVLAQRKDDGSVVALAIVRRR